MIISGVHPVELMRIRHCQGCQYLGGVGANGYCKYYIATGIRRPNKFGVENCSVKLLEDAPEKVEEAIRKTLEWNDKVEAMKAKNAPAWNVELAKRLYDDGKSFREIGDAVCRKSSTISDYARKHHWSRG